MSNSFAVSLPIDMSILTNILYILIAIVIVTAVYIAVGKMLKGLRLRGVISRRIEELIKIIVLVFLILISIPIAVSNIIQYSLWFSVAIAVIAFALVIIMLKTFIENTFSYLILVSSGILRDGESIQINVNGVTYEGRVSLLEGNFMEILTHDNKIVYVPYKHVLNSVITKQSLQNLKFKLIVHGHGIDIDKTSNIVKEVLLKSRFVVAINELRLLEIREEEVSFLIEISLRNPDSATQCLSDIYKMLSKNVSHRLRIEML